MTVRVRAIEPTEAAALNKVVETAFGETPSAEEVDDELAWIEVDRALAAEEGDELVGATAAYSFRMTVPGGDSLPVAGVTWVGVLPTHRRRGVASALMRRQLDDVAAAGEPIAVLTASEASIYGRFGYGLASRLAKVTIDTARGLPLVAPPEAPGRFRLVDAAEAEPHARRLIDDVLPQRAGELTRPDRWWPVFQRDRPDGRRGASARFWVLHEASDGTVDGLAHYRVREHWGDDDAIPRNEVQLGEVWAPDAEVEAALLLYLAELDLTTSITTWGRPVDDPFRLRLVDDRRYRVSLLHDHLYVRVLDVVDALAARTYDAAGDVVLGIDDLFRPATSGRYRLKVAEPGAAAVVERVGGIDDGDADAFCPVDVLGSLYLGDVTAAQLAAAGRLAPGSAPSLVAIDRMFRTTRAPYCTMRF